MQIFTADDGTLYTKTPTGAALTSRTVPSGLTNVNKKPSFAKYRRTVVISGKWTRGLVYRDDLDKFFVLGIAPPSTKPTLVAAGTGDQVGPFIGFYTFVHKDGATVVAESGPSPASTTVTATSASQIAWSGILATSPDTRVTHIRLYRSDGGNDPRQVVELAIGTTTYTDTVHTLNLGVVMKDAGGVPPYTAYNCTYNKRIFYAGDPTYPDRIWYSESEDPENVDSLNFFKTTSGEAVTGLGTANNQLVICTANTTDVLQEFQSGDFALLNKSNSIGCISHFSMVNIHDRLWFASQAGVYVYDGSFKYVTADLRAFWKSDYAAHPTEYEQCFAADDRPEYCYILSIPFTSPPIGGTGTFRWVAYYLPFEPSVGGGEAQPWWFFDKRTRMDKSLGLLTYGNVRFRLYVGSADGYLRQEDVDSDSSDDSDTFLKALTITTKHFLMDEPGGDSESGKNLIDFWSYVESESNAWKVSVYGGDESATGQLNPNWKDDVAASAQATQVEKTVHPHVPEQVSGRGFSWKYTANSPVSMKWRGFGGNWSLGPSFRGKNS